MDSIVGVIVAGGKSSRMQQDKAHTLLQQLPLIEHVLHRATPQVTAIAINSNAPTEAFLPYKCVLLADTVEGFLGPLAGILTGLEWACQKKATWLATFAVDTPYFPTDIVARLHQAACRDGSLIATARSNGREHPVFSIWHTSLLDSLHTALTTDGIRKIIKWRDQHHATIVDFALADNSDPFVNINTPEDLAQLDVPLPPLATINEASDMSPFMQSNISEATRKKALQLFFGSAIFNNTDGLDVYAEDFSKFEPLGDIVTAEMKHRLKIMEKIFAKEETEEEIEAETVETIEDDNPADSFERLASAPATATTDNARNSQAEQTTTPQTLDQQKTNPATLSADTAATN